MNKMQTSDEKLSFIYALEEVESLDNDDWTELERLLFDTDSEVRLQASEVLALFPSEKSENLLLGLLNDPDYLVRASVCDSLSFSKSQKTLNLLIQATRDPRYLVRGYAILSIGDIQQSLESDSDAVVKLLKHLEKKESSEWVKIAIYRSLFLLGQYSYGDNLLERLDSRYYRNRCFTISLLKELLESNLICKFSKIKPALQQRLKIEKTNSVKTKLIDLLNVLTEAS